MGKKKSKNSSKKKPEPQPTPVASYEPVFEDVGSDPEEDVNVVTKESATKETVSSTPDDNDIINIAKESSSKPTSSPALKHEKPINKSPSPTSFKELFGSGKNDEKASNEKSYKLPPRTNTSFTSNNSNVSFQPGQHTFPGQLKSVYIVHTDEECCRAFSGKTGIIQSSKSKSSKNNNKDKDKDSESDSPTFDSIDFFKRAMGFGMRQFDNITEAAKRGEDDMEDPLDMYLK